MTPETIDHLIVGAAILGVAIVTATAWVQGADE